MAKRLVGAGISEANGFALNVSNYVTTRESVAYGKEISAAIGGAVPFVIDTSRNGKGAALDKQWCNPKGRGIGARPTANTGDPLVHAYLWVKRPGESDGTCNGGPSAGHWWPEMALELSRNDEQTPNKAYARAAVMPANDFTNVDRLGPSRT